MQGQIKTGPARDPKVARTKQLIIFCPLRVQCIRLSEGEFQGSSQQGRLLRARFFWLTTEHIADAPDQIAC